MKKILGVALLILSQCAYTACCSSRVQITTTTVSTGTNICYDGRILRPSPGGLAWQVKRGCFMTRKPCSDYDAGFYGRFNNDFHLKTSYVRCRQYYPWRLGMQ